MAKLFTVRHGETGWEAENRMQGWLDMPLNVRGLDQARELASQLSDKDITVVYSSTLMRAFGTAEVIANHLEVEVVEDENLMELDQGKWNGLRVEEIRKKFGRFYEKWYDDPFAVRPPGGELLSEAQNRATSALKKIFQDHQGENVCLVTHQIMSTLINLQLTTNDFSAILASLQPIATWDEIEIPRKPSW